MAGKELTNIQVYRKRWNINIGVIIFGVVFIYLLVTVLLYLTEIHVSVYEVREGSILKDTAYTGFIVREEVLVLAEEDGYINYFATEGSKVGAKTRVYTLSEKELAFADADGSQDEKMTSEEQEALLLRTQSFSENFDEQQFDDVYTLRNTITTVLESKSSQSRETQLDAMLADNTTDLQIYTAATDGVIMYTTDGYEGISMGDVTEEMIAKKGYESKSLGNNSRVKAGDPVYKLIRSDQWTVAILLSDEAAQNMADMKSVKVRFGKDNETTWAELAIYNTENANLGFLTFESSMIRYAQERYIDLELILEDQSGLKIPKSSVTEKQFYVVPEKYLTQGGNNKDTGVLVDNGSDNAKFKNVEVYYRDHDLGLVYLDPTVLEEGTLLRQPEGADTYELGEKKA